ncbi:MAG: D-sedoheptulose 7-phosphate isomerase [Bacteroidota bacterium]|nr:D-sedoheptulose 7-phosphate isomerase [Bacteroidota bacterium]
MHNLKEVIKTRIISSLEVKNKILQDEKLITLIADLSILLTNTFKNNGKLLLCGNGGSAADAQHIAAEFTGRFYIDRPPLNAEALHVNSSYLTSVANDYSFDEVYARMVQATGKKNDILIGISTSGNSVNVVKAIEMANKMDMITIGFTGETGGKMKDICNHILNVPSSDTPRIQEAHILAGHIICELVESNMSL